jgi:5-oxoprolinase (ATP-hydrolysing)
MDQGGTFTDLVIHKEDGSVEIEKVLTASFQDYPLIESATKIRRGTTVATNALLERKGVKTVLITNIGFGDLKDIGDQRREKLFDITASKTVSLGDAVLEIEGRIAADGKILRPAILPIKKARELLQEGFVSAAVVLIHGPRAPQEEHRIAQQLLSLGFEHVSIGSEVSPKIGFCIRLQSTLADACLTPLLPRKPGLYMKSNGGLAESTAADWRGVNAVLSGPAGGAIAVEKLLSQLSIERAFGLDMGGTSADVCHIYKKVGRVEKLIVNHWPIHVPSIHIETVAAGGGSILSQQEGIFRVGPQSAGSVPGPAGYGRNGPPTLTDCEVVLGRLVGFPPLCGPEHNRPLDVEASQEALTRLDPTRSVEEVAIGFKQVAAEEMASAILRHAANLGVDPSEHALVVFGGAGAAHACDIAHRLEINTVIVPVLAGVFSAIGIGVSTRRDQVSRMVLNNDINTAIQYSRNEIPWDGNLELVFDVRYKGTSSTIQTYFSESPEPTVSMIKEQFESRHKSIFGFHRNLSVEVIAVSIVVSEESRSTQVRVPPVRTDVCSTKAYFNGLWQTVPVLPFQEVDICNGPAILLVHGSTISLPKGWSCQRQENALVLSDITRSYPVLGLEFHPAKTAIFGRRVMSVAEEMGEVLARLARSVSIRERRDFSCAIFDNRGQLVANAPHVPVHLGAMGKTIRQLLLQKEGELQPDQAWLSNDPYSGGSHLPDITMIMPVYQGVERIAFVASRGHHIDIGGTHPGSMPPRAKHISEEGMLWKFQKFYQQGQFYSIDLKQSRQPDDVLADLEAQTAACLRGVQKVGKLCLQLSLEIFSAQMQHVQSHAERVCLRWMKEHQGTYKVFERISSELNMMLELEIKKESGTLRLEAPKSSTNLNTPKAVVSACLLYVLRSLINEEIPLNEGTLKPWQIEVNHGGLFDPEYPVAVAGGNVETSQHVVDAMLRALGIQASSQGTMNNLCVGTFVGAFYETLGGGAGATQQTDGGSAVQVHMTNTKGTDVEELEHRFPVQILCWKIRKNSGGEGLRKGGDGMVKEWLFLAPASVSILATRRKYCGKGLFGGGSGDVGKDERDIGFGWEVSPVEWEAKRGDKLRISTPGGSGYGG